ncbi:MAG: ANTAR domain-containing protein [Pseudomonadota bacterium]
MAQPLTIMVVEPDRDRALQIVDGLRDAGGDNTIHVVDEAGGLTRKIASIEPDVVLIDVANPSRDTLEELALAAGPTERPVAMFVDQSTEGLTTQAIEAGFSAYVVDGLQPDRLRKVLDAAVVRFRMMQRMRTELQETKRALEERKVIDRAKGILMSQRGLSEDDAYALLRKTAMGQNKRLAEVAQSLVTAAELLG